MDNETQELALRVQKLERKVESLKLQKDALLTEFQSLRMDLVEETESYLTTHVALSIAAVFISVGSLIYQMLTH